MDNQKNTGDRNTGYCNSITPEDCFIFNKPSTFKAWSKASIPRWMNVRLVSWIVESRMTDKERKAYPSYITTGGYLKFYSSMKAAFIESWKNTTQEDRDLTKKLPNFDPIEFKKVFGFNPFKEEK